MEEFGGCGLDYTPRGRSLRLGQWESGSLRLMQILQVGSSGCHTWYLWRAVELRSERSFLGERGMIQISIERNLALSGTELCALP
jgi:hypothetical protein